MAPLRASTGMMARPSRTGISDRRPEQTTRMLAVQSLRFPAPDTDIAAAGTHRARIAER
jgi:hypothetical protein